MGKYSSILLTGGQEPKQSSGKKYSEILLDGKPLEGEFNDQPDRAPTGEISAVTGKEIKEVTGNPSYTPASFDALFKAGYVDSNEAKIKIFSEARGIDPKRYTVKDGKIWFQGDDGGVYPESPREFDSLIKKLVAELPSEGLADIGAGIGAIFNVPGAMVGAGLGEVARKQVGEHIFNDDQNAGDYVKDVGLQMLFAGLDSRVAKGVMNKINSAKIKKATGGRLTGKLVGDVGDISDAQRAAGRAVREKGENIGVDVLPHQAMDDPTLTGYYKMLRDNPQTARQVRVADDRLETQVEKAGNDLVLEISPKETDPYEVGNRLSKAADKVLKKLRKERGDIAGTQYDKAYSSGVEVDTQPIIDEISRLKKKVKPGMKAYSALAKVERWLWKKGKDGKNIPETDIQVLDNAKVEIDQILNAPAKDSVQGRNRHRLKKVKDQLTTQTDAVSPDYQKARKLFELASPKVTEAETGIIGALAGMKTENVKEAAIKKIFASPRSIRVAKRYIEKESPELWKDAVAEYFRGAFEKAAKVAQGSGGKVLNRPGKYTSKMWDLSDQRKLKFATEGMKDANGEPLYDRISDFFEVMQKASIGQGKESATQSRQQMKENLSGLAGKISSRLLGLKAAAVDMFFQGAKERAFDKNAKKLLDLMQTQEGVELIAKAKGFGTKAEGRVNALATLLMMATETNIDKSYEAFSTLGKPDQSVSAQAPQSKGSAPR